MGNFVFIPEEDYNQLKLKVDGIYEYITFLKKSDDQLITTDELLKYVPISKSTLQHYRDRKLIRFTQRGRKILYSRTEVIDDLKNMNKM